MLIHGSCHCGNIAFELALDGDPKEIPARACDCTFCTKHGGLWTSSPTASLKVSVKDPARVSRYAFGTKTALFHICTRCGIVPLVTSEIDGHLYAVASVNAFNGVDPALIQRKPISFEGEMVDSRLARRTRNWIAKVEFVEGA